MHRARALNERTPRATTERRSRESTPIGPIDTIQIRPDIMLLLTIYRCDCIVCVCICVCPQMSRAQRHLIHSPCTSIYTRIYCIYILFVGFMQFLAFALYTMWLRQWIPCWVRLKAPQHSVWYETSFQAWNWLLWSHKIASKCTHTHTRKQSTHKIIVEPQTIRDCTLGSLRAGERVRWFRAPRHWTWPFHFSWGGCRDISLHFYFARTHRILHDLGVDDAVFIRITKKIHQSVAFQTAIVLWPHSTQSRWSFAFSLRLACCRRALIGALCANVCGANVVTINDRGYALCLANSVELCALCSDWHQGGASPVIMLSKILATHKCCAIIQVLNKIFT